MLTMTKSCFLLGNWRTSSSFKSINNNINNFSKPKCFKNPKKLSELCLYLSLITFKIWIYQLTYRFSAIFYSAYLLFHMTCLIMGKQNYLSTLSLLSSVALYVIFPVLSARITPPMLKRSYLFLFKGPLYGFLYYSVKLGATLICKGCSNPILFIMKLLCKPRISGRSCSISFLSLSRHLISTVSSYILIRP